MKGTVPPPPALDQAPLKRLDDPRFLRLQGLRARKARDRAGLFFVEGLRFVARALQRHAPLQAVLVVPKMLAHPFAPALLRRLRERRVPVLDMTPELFLRLSRAEDPQWIGAVAAQRWEPLDSVRADGALCWLALDTVHSPGNLGTILRTGEAVGAAGLILIGDDVDPYDPACVRATMGAIFAQHFVRTTPVAFAAFARRGGCRLVGTSPHAAQDYRAVGYREAGAAGAPLVLYMGGERQGLSENSRRLCHAVVRIPMVGNGDSLNLAVATGVLLYEVFNQRRAREGPGKTNSRPIR